VLHIEVLSNGKGEFKLFICSVLPA
jgi:hypothetical protein